MVHFLAWSQSTPDSTKMEPKAPPIGIELCEKLRIAEQMFDLLAEGACEELILAIYEVDSDIAAVRELDELVSYYSQFWYS